VTIDAIGTQTHIAQTIVEAQADYVLSVKENQGHLFEDISVLFAVDQAHDFKHATLEHHQEVNKGHGRIETRECWCTSDPTYLNLIRDRANWTALQSVAMIVSTRIVAGSRPKRPVTIFPVCPVTHSDYCILCADIGQLKMNCIGSWMWL
jgi:predicted transposase YbfD/YdcC